ncbi:glycerophosphodiester phosphodiesterase [Haloplanus rubicundus]|uniref:glycerophosphodiester phosphodiesterase n=1 Tax=Haloplanus rubicundus TaxID=1547898 RepID=UPI0021CB45D3|nr:glycerophosphodiester phosphodiesterase [Haloplanus rubicundus]
MTTIIAHRGFAGLNPENTVGAVRAAADRTDRVEVDVVACADGTPVVFHDARLDAEADSRGVTDGSGAVADLPSAAVTAAEVLESGQRVPTLDRLLAETDVPLDVELKRPGAGTGPRGSLPPADRDAARERWLPFVDRVLDLIDGRDARYSSFFEGALAAVRERDASAVLAPLCTDLDTGRALATRYDAGAIHPSLAAVRAAESVPADRTVNVWTVRTWVEARAAVEAGADGLIADYPGLTRWIGKGTGSRD